jgi:hypothetical protein
MSEHTPGPWVWRWKDQTLRVAGDGNPYPFTNKIVLQLDPGMSITDADHQLIAAAPDLLAALQMAATQFDFYAAQHDAKGTPESAAKADVNRALVAMCRAAIAKAEGRGS